MSLLAALLLAQAAPAPDTAQPHPGAKTYESFCIS